MSVDRVYPESLIEAATLAIYDQRYGKNSAGTRFDILVGVCRNEARAALDAVFSWREGDTRVLVGEQVGWRGTHDVHCLASRQYRATDVPVFQEVTPEEEK